MSLRDKLKGMAKDRRDDVAQEKQDKAGRPDKDKDHLHIYRLIESGIQIGGEFRVGATDSEIQYAMQDFGVKDSTIRFIRWSMEKAGYVKNSGNRRALMSGKPKSNVWVVTDKFEKEREKQAESKDILLLGKDGIEI